jgi:hypothetical protein
VTAARRIVVVAGMDSRSAEEIWAADEKEETYGR